MGKDKEAKVKGIPYVVILMGTVRKSSDIVPIFTGIFEPDGRCFHFTDDPPFPRLLPDGAEIKSIVIEPFRFPDEMKKGESCLKVK
jgi:hypothetical protein